MPTSGVFLNMVTKSGGERGAAARTFAWLGDATQTQNIDDELLRYGFRPETNAVDFVSDINISGGGPVIARKLRMFASFRDWRVHVNVPAAFSTLVLDKTDITSGLVNANYQINDNNRLTGLYSRQYYKKPNRFLDAPTTSRCRNRPTTKTTCSTSTRCCGTRCVTQTLLHRRARRPEQDLLPDLSERQRPDAARHGDQHPHAQLHAGTERWRDRYQMNATGQYYVDESLGGRHEFKFGFDYAHSPVENRTCRFDDVDMTYSSATGLVAERHPVSRRRSYTKTAVDVTALYAQDSYSIKNG